MRGVSAICILCLIFFASNDKATSACMSIIRAGSFVNGGNLGVRKWKAKAVLPMKCIILTHFFFIHRVCESAQNISGSDPKNPTNRNCLMPESIFGFLYHSFGHVAKGGHSTSRFLNAWVKAELATRPKANFIGLRSRLKLRGKLFVTCRQEVSPGTGCKLNPNSRRNWVVHIHVHSRSESSIVV